MITRLILIVLITIAAIAWDYSKRHDVKKSSIAVAAFIAIFAMAFAGGVMRAILPLFLLHILAVITAWGALMWYLIKGKFYFWALFFPLATIALFVIMNFMEGSRYEG